jgi:N-acetylglucosaminyldiphosphoundecaprenol N-acetyl-beta-D-mannosaminyltransferase
MGYYMLQLKQTELLVSQIKSKKILSKNNLKELPCNEYSVIFNTESAWHFLHNDLYRDYVLSCDNIAIDGAGLSATLKLCGCIVKRFHGPDLCQALIENASQADEHILVVGGHNSNSELVKSKLVNGFYPLPMMSRSEDFQENFEGLKIFINQFSGKKIILVSLGLPKQELFCKWLLSELRIDRSVDCDDIIILPVGAALDFLSGHRKRASHIWQKFGLEWLPRLIREPRMFLRVVRSFRAMVALVFSKAVLNRNRKV